MLDHVGDFSEIVEAGAQCLRNGKEFVYNGVTYELAAIGKGEHAIHAYFGGKFVGETWTQNRGIHAGLIVHGDKYRNQGIGTMLFHLKAELDGGVFEHEWSTRCSRMLFLIRRGYVPTGFVGNTSSLNSDTTLGEGDFAALASYLLEYMGDKTKENLQREYRLRYDPQVSRKFIQEFNLGATSIGFPERVLQILSSPPSSTQVS